MQIKEYHDRLQKAVGRNIVTMNRPAIPEARRLGLTQVDLRYVEIKDFEQFNHPDLDFFDGEEWITIILVNHDD